MANNKITSDQIGFFDPAFHKLWFKIMTNRPESKSKELNGLTFSNIHVIRMAYEESDVLFKDIREKIVFGITMLPD